jgi:hypothetical protein
VVLGRVVIAIFTLVLPSNSCVAHSVPPTRGESTLGTSLPEQSEVS